jgi:hypothetical protein
MSALHLEVLTAEGREALRLHGHAAEREGFHLAGGTALALQLGHRSSIDFDWFRAEELEPLELARRLTDGGVPFETRSTARGTLHGSIVGVRVSFIEFRYPLLEPARECELGFRLAGLRDIGAMKLAAVSQRGARKDFYDLVALDRAGLPLAKLLDDFRLRFRVSDLAHVLTALTYFDDADRDPEPVVGAREDWAAVKRTVLARVRELASS